MHEKSNIKIQSGGVARTLKVFAGEQELMGVTGVSIDPIQDPGQPITATIAVTVGRMSMEPDEDDEPAAGVL